MKSLSCVTNQLRNALPASYKAAVVANHFRPLYFKRHPPVKLYYLLQSNSILIEQSQWLFLSSKRDKIIWKQSFSFCTLFENYSKCRIQIFEFWHFPPFFFLLKLTCRVILFDRKLQVFKKLAKMDHFWHF